jgi:hypothetical protein
MNRKKQPPEVLMSYAQSPPLVEDEWFTDPVSSDAPLRSPNLRSERRMPEPRPASVRAPRSSGRKAVQEVIDRPSLSWRIFRSFTRFVILISIGVGAALGAQTDTAKEILLAQAPTLAWALSISPTKSLGVATSAQQAEPLTSALMSNLDAMRRSVEQLAARQDQMAQSLAALQAADEDIRQQISGTPPTQPREAATNPQPRPLQARVPLPVVPTASAPRLAPAPGSAAPSTR